MFPSAPAPATFTGMRPGIQTPDALLGEADRAGLRGLYPDPGDTAHVGSITGRILLRRIHYRFPKRLLGSQESLAHRWLQWTLRQAQS
jgi:hypothetical protein